jgi:hypothetical protein
VFDPSSKSRLTTYDLGRFPGDTLFDQIARAVCRAGCLPRKELFEAWEVARRVRRRFRGGRVADLCAGHGLLGHLMLLLDDTSPEVRLVDPRLPPSAAAIHRELLAAWPRIAGRVHLHPSAIADTEVRHSDLVVSVHACGSLTDQVIARAVATRARVAVLPCCHNLDDAETGSLTGWIDGPTAVDVVRASNLRASGWRVWTQQIPAAITPHNRLLMAAPPDHA